MWSRRLAARISKNAAHRRSAASVKLRDGELWSRGGGPLDGEAAWGRRAVRTTEPVGDAGPLHDPLDPAGHRCSVGRLRRVRERSVRAPRRAALADDGLRGRGLLRAGGPLVALAGAAHGARRRRRRREPHVARPARRRRKKSGAVLAAVVRALPFALAP